MGIPVINLEELNGKRRHEMMSKLHEACARWGFFSVENHGICEESTGKVKELVKQHYEENMKEVFFESALVKELGSQLNRETCDWESSFFVCHRSNPNVDVVPNLNEKLSKAMKDHVDQLIRVAETLAEAMSENLGLDSNHIKNAFSKPSVGTKVAIYPQCPKPELVMGLRAHTDAGGIILLLQDDTVPGLEFFKDEKWVPINPTKENRIFVNLGDQLEVVSNGVYKSVWHRVLADRDGSRLSIATFYNPGADSVISPAAKAMYPSGYRFQDYLSFYSKSKFSDKEARFRTFKEMNM